MMRDYSYAYEWDQEYCYPNSNVLINKGHPIGCPFCSLNSTIFDTYTIFKMMSSNFSQVHLYDSPEKAVQKSEGLYELPERQENNLSHMEEPSEKKIHYDRYFYGNTA